MTTPTTFASSETSTATRRGKIARLPAPIRRLLNLRLENNEPADTILPWLNNLPETQRILAAQFAGAPITPQNLSEWRHGGFRQWQLLQELLDHATRLHEGVAELTDFDPAALADDVAAALTARYAALLAHWDGEITPEFEAKIKLLRGLTRDVASLQKSLHTAARQTRDLRRDKQQDAAADLAKLKKEVSTRLDYDNRLRRATHFHAHAARPILAVEDAQSPAQVLEIWTRSQTPSDPIQLDPTKITPNPAPEAPLQPATPAAA